MPMKRAMHCADPQSNTGIIAHAKALGDLLDRRIDQARPAKAAA